MIADVPQTAIGFLNQMKRKQEEIRERLTELKSRNAERLKAIAGGMEQLRSKAGQAQERHAQQKRRMVSLRAFCLRESLIPSSARAGVDNRLDEKAVRPTGGREHGHQFAGG